MLFLGFPGPFLVFLAFFIKALWCEEYSTDCGLGFSRGGGKSGCGFDANLEKEMTDGKGAVLRKAHNWDDPDEVDSTVLRMHRMHGLYKPWKNMRSRVVSQIFRCVASQSWGQVCAGFCWF